MTPLGERNRGALWARRLEELERENRLLRQQLQRALEENERLKQEHARLRQESERLRRQLEEALRVAKRQAAPFSRGQPKPNPKPPGRKAGENYGSHHRRPFPRRVDEQIAVPLPARCPGCGGRLEFERTEPQYAGRHRAPHRVAALRRGGGTVPGPRLAGGGPPPVEVGSGERAGPREGAPASVLRTCRQQGHNVFALLVRLLRSPAAQALNIVPNGQSP